jgi:transcriptional regulator with XRE-family HTH domain
MAAMSLGSRAWWAWHCLKRDANGDPPQLKQFERDNDIPNGTMARVFSGERQSPTPETIVKMAKALGVSTAFLVEGAGSWPLPTGPVPQRKITHEGQTRLPAPIFESTRPPNKYDMANDFSARAVMHVANPEHVAADDELAPLRRHAAALLQLPPYDYPEKKAKEMVQAVLGFKHDTALDADEVAKLADHVERVVSGLPAREPTRSKR